MIPPTFQGRLAFVRENTRPQAPPHTPELTLNLADEITPIWRMTDQVLQSRAKLVQTAASRLSAEFGARDLAKSS